MEEVVLTDIEHKTIVMLIASQFNQVKRSAEVRMQVQELASLLSKLNGQGKSIVVRKQNNG